MDSQKTLNIVSGYKPQFLAEPFQFLQPKTFVRNQQDAKITGRDRNSSGERSNRSYSPQSSKVCIEFLPSEEEIRPIQTCDKSQEFNNKKRSHAQLDSRKQVIAFQDRVITINIKEAQHPLKCEKQVIDKSSIMLKISTKSMHRVLV